MTYTVADVMDVVARLWPESLAESWDEVGLVVGDPQARVRKILWAVDPVSDVLDEAIDAGADLIIAHHPLLLQGITSVATTSWQGQLIHKMITASISLLTIHTNGDSAQGGVSDVLAHALGVQHLEPLLLSPTSNGKEGLGRVGNLPGTVLLGDFVSKVVDTLPPTAGGVRVSGNSHTPIRRVAVCGGSGGSLIKAAQEQGADVYVTADLKHHLASETREESSPLSLVDVSHWASEWLWLPNAAALLKRCIQEQGSNIEMHVSTRNTDPWVFSARHSSFMKGSPA